MNKVGTRDYPEPEMEETQETVRPSKRIKLDLDQQPENQPNDIPAGETHVPSSIPSNHPQVNGINTKATMEAQALKESEVGIIGYVSSSSESFTGILKKRYTDFLVNEILPNGEVCHLKTTKAPKANRREAYEQARGDDVQHVKVEAAHDHLVNQNDDESVSARTELTNGVEQHSATNGESGASDEVKEAKTPESDPEPAQQPTEAQEAPKEGEISSDDRALLVSYLSESAVTELLKLYNKILANPNIKPKEHGTVRTDFTSDRSIRGQIHQAIRRIFSSRIDSSTDNDGILVLSAALPSYRQPRNQPGRGGHGGGRDRGGKPTWAERGGNFLHFSLFKENKDTMEVVAFLAKQLKTKPRDFQFAGTKDRRAVTVQRVSAYRLDAERVASLNRMLRGSQVGDFSYQPQGLELGDLKGNEFVITLRECQFPSIGINYSMPERVAMAKTLITNALTSLHTHGFTNYYGLQRFGTYSTRTDTIGLALLQGNFQLATSLILSYSHTPRTLVRSGKTTNRAPWQSPSSNPKTPPSKKYSTPSPTNSPPNPM
jgi:tRNA pseudouridine13 synthase